MKWFKKKKITNCVFLALYLYYRHGGYVIYRRSKLVKWLFHCIYSKDLKKFIHTIPEYPRDVPYPVFKAKLVISRTEPGKVI